MSWFMRRLWFDLCWSMTNAVQNDVSRVREVVQCGTGSSIDTYANDASDQYVSSQTSSTVSTNLSLDLDRTLFVAFLLSEGSEFGLSLYLDGTWRTWAVLTSRCADLGVVW